MVLGVLKGQGQAPNGAFFRLGARHRHVIESRVPVPQGVRGKHFEKRLPSPRSRTRAPGASRAPLPHYAVQPAPGPPGTQTAPRPRPAPGPAPPRPRPPRPAPLLAHSDVGQG